MKTRSNIVSRAVLIALGVVGVTSTALADRPHWAKKSHGHHGRQYSDSRDYRDDRDSQYGQYAYASANGYARVVDVEPIVRRVRVSSPQRECWNEERAVRSGPSRTEIRATIVGGLIGAAVGHRVSGRHDVPTPVAMVGGSLLGAAIGNGIGANRAARRGEYRDVGYESVQRCEVGYRDEWAEQIDGYQVTYVYRGREYTTRMPYDPGQRIRVDVDVRPVFENRHDDRYDDRN